MCGPNCFISTAAYWNGTSIHLLTANGEATGVNESGDMVGYVYSQGGDSPAIWSPTGNLTLAPRYPNSTDTVFADINDQRVIVGQAVLTNGRFVHFVRSQQGYEFLGIESAEFYRQHVPSRINAHGQIIATGKLPGSAASEQLFIITPKDTNGDGAPDRWFEPKDGKNGLARPLHELLAPMPGVEFRSAFRNVAPINDFGQIAGNMTVNGQSAGFRMTPFVKYKQFDTKWGDKPVNLDAQADSFTDFGCTVSSLATVATYFGNYVDPLSMRDHLHETDLFDDARGAAMNVNQFSYQSNGLYVRTNRRGDDPNTAAVEGNLDTIVQELRTGKPVLLAVPSASRSAIETQGSEKQSASLHYIVAYGLNPTLRPTAAWDIATIASHIFIADPGHSNESFYSD
jgi:hypothetical protein